MLVPGQIVGERYRVIRELGSGGFGRVYLVEELERRSDGRGEGDTLPLFSLQPLVLRQVALKTFATRERLCHDLVMELRALCRLSHPHIVSVYDYQVSDPPFIAMEYVPGQDLENHLAQRGPLGVFDALAVARQVGSALAHAHSASVLHRDVKPSNVIVTEDLRAKLVDFGLARNFERLSQLTTRLGTPGFVAPELLDPQRFRYPVGVAADVYGFGSLLAALLTGQSPFGRGTPVEILRNQMDDHRTLPSDLHPLLRAVIERATAVSPSDRHPSIPALLEQLRRIQEGLMRPVSLPLAEPERVDVLDGQVVAVAEFSHPIRGRGVKFEIATPKSSQVQRGFVYEESVGKGPGDLYQSLRCAWEGCELSLYSAVPLRSDRKGEFMTGDGLTVPVLEPHFLVSVTDVVASRGVRAPDCPARPFVDLREPDRHSLPLFVGGLLHQVMDQLVQAAPGRHSFSEVIEERLARNRLAAVATGLTDADLASVRREISGPCSWLQQLLSRQLEPSGRSTEVTRFSGKYGLEGRIDLAIVAPDRLELLELKTGKRQPPEHELQLRCYALLWDEYAGANGKSIQGRLIYSQPGLEKGVARLDHAQERPLLRSRNEIVAAHHALARGDLEGAMPAHGQWPERCGDLPCQYRQDRCRQQCANLGLTGQPRSGGSSDDLRQWHPVPPHLVSAARVYYRHFIRLVELEYLSLSRGQGEFTRSGGLDQRIEDLQAAAGVELVEWDPGSRAVRLAGSELVRFVPGTEVVLHRGAPDRDPILMGRIEVVDGDSVVIRCQGVEGLQQLSRDGWILERYLPRIGQVEVHQALYSLLTVRDPERLASILWGGDQESNGHSVRMPASPGVGEDALPPELNASQREAVLLALGESRPVLIHGPPGTGKTTVIAQLVERLVEQGKRVLVSAGTNTAVDNILLHLAKAGVDFLRLGHLEVDSPLRRRLSPEQIGRQVARDLGLSEPSVDRIAQRLRTVPVVAGTAHRCIRSHAMQAIKRLSGGPGRQVGPPVPFDVALVDEATQLVEPLALGVVLLARRFVLVGDRCQLPPVVTADEARTAYVRESPDEAAKRMNLRGLDFTLFERLTGRTPEVVLEVQYRMNRQIQELSNRLYYDGMLIPHPEVSNRRLSLLHAALRDLPGELVARWDPKRPLVWETLEGTDSGRCNPVEVKAVCETIAALFLSKVVEPEFASQIGVISPFRAQCFAIRQALGEVLGKETARLIEVDTAERFQGREKEVIFVSLVVSTWSDFVMDARRLNVAFTRARSKLIVFGPLQVISGYLAGHGDGAPPPLADRAQGAGCPGGSTPVDGEVAG